MISVIVIRYLSYHVKIIYSISTI